MIVDAHGFESVLDGSIKFERKPWCFYGPDHHVRPKLLLALRALDPRLAGPPGTPRSTDSANTKSE